MRESIAGSLDNTYNVIALSQGIADFNYESFIYPYEKFYDFEPTCSSCKFRELSDSETLALSIATGGGQKSPVGVDDSGRNPARVKGGEQPSDPDNSSAAGASPQ